LRASEIARRILDVRAADLQEEMTAATQRTSRERQRASKPRIARRRAEE
jgi:hypothetical protein